MKHIKLDGEVADRICRANIRQHFKYLKKEVEAAEKDPTLTEAQTLDMMNNALLIKSMKKVLEYFGG
jgi:hypothetical protein